MFWKILKYLSDFSNQNEKVRDLRNLSVYKKTKLFWLKSKKKKIEDVGGEEKEGKEGKRGAIEMIQNYVLLGIKLTLKMPKSEGILTVIEWMLCCYAINFFAVFPFPQKNLLKSNALWGECFGEEGSEFHFRLILAWKRKSSYNIENNPLPRQTFGNSILEPEVTMKNKSKVSG